MDRVNGDGEVQACRMHDMKFKKITINGKISDSYFSSTDFRKTSFIENTHASIVDIEKNFFCGNFYFDANKIDGSKAFFSQSQLSTASLTEFLNQSIYACFCRIKASFSLADGNRFTRSEFSGGNDVTESLTIVGDIKSGAKITLQSSEPCELIVHGTVHESVHIGWRGSIIFKKDFLGNNINVVNHEGDMTAKNLGENTYLTTHKGNLAIGSTEKGSQLTSHNGNISVETHQKVK